MFHPSIWIHITCLGAYTLWVLVDPLAPASQVLSLARWTVKQLAHTAHARVGDAGAVIVAAERHAHVAHRIGEIQKATGGHRGAGSRWGSRWGSR